MTGWKSVTYESIKNEATAVAPSVCFQIVLLITSTVSMSHNLARFIWAFTWNYPIFGLQKYIILHSTSQNVSLVFHCDSI